MLLRIFASLALLFSILFMPFWVSVLLGLAGMTYFSFFLETIFLFLLSDLLYGTQETNFFGITFASFGVAVICFIILEILKKKLRFNPK